MTLSLGFDYRAKRALTTVAVAAGLLLLDGRLGPVSFPLRRVAASTLLVIVILCVVRPRGWLASTFAFWGSVVFTAIAPTVPLALLAYIFAAAMAGMNSASSTSPLARGLPQSCLAYVGIRFLSELIPQSRAVGASVSTAAHGYLRVVTESDHHLSLTALGGPAVVLLAVFLLWRWRLSGSWARLLGAAAVPLAWFVLLPLVVPAASAGPIGVFTRGAWYGLLWIGCSAIIDAAAPWSAGVACASGRATLRSLLISAGECAAQFTNRSSERQGTPLPCGAVRPDEPGGLLPYPSTERRACKLALALAVCAASLLIGATLSGGIISSIPANQSILVHNRGGLDWERPVFGKFGAFSGGMFGLLPVYARANGYRFEVLDQDAIKPDDLAGFQTLVLINSPKEWKGDELRTVRDFVANGGSLLVLGDHTDVYGLMRGFNSLLDGFGILFEFDSAYPAREGWRGCLAAAPDAVASGWEIESPGVAIGASLKLHSASRALLRGRYAHSDIGARGNVIGSFLGNYAYDEGEELGDVVLAASVTHGRGRVVVLGDTSPFQGGLSYSFPRTVGPILSFLSRPTSVFERPAMRTLAAALLTSILLISWASRAETSSTAMISATLFVGVAGGWSTGRSQLHSPISIAPDCFFIDQSHLPAVGHYEAKVNPSGSLNTNLLRCGLRVADLAEWDFSALSEARGIAFIAPQRSFTQSEVEDMLRFEEAGGVVLLAVGYPDSSASRPLLDAHGLHIEARPLGTVPDAAASSGERERERPRFLDAWPIVSTSGKDLATIPAVDVLYRAENDVIALFRKHGRGGLLFFADSRFFSSMNIEDTWGHWVGNLALIHDAFRRYLAVDPDAVRPVFRSPSKPE